MGPTKPQQPTKKPDTRFGKLDTHFPTDYNDLVDHVAIMKKSWKLLPKILNGEKKIESRWYQTKRVPWGKIQPGETVYFKNSGEPIILKAFVERVLQFEHLNKEQVSKIIDRYGPSDGLGISDVERFKKMFRQKKYCLLIFLKNPVSVEPFEIDKIGFGTMTAWIAVRNIRSIKIRKTR